MPLDFTVVSAVRQRFGDQKPDRNQSESERESSTLAEANAPFVGPEKSFPFDCPNVDRTQWAVLLFESYGVTKRQAMQINNQTVHGGIPEDVEQNTKIFGTGSDEHPVAPNQLPPTLNFYVTSGGTPLITLKVVGHPRTMPVCKPAFRPTNTS